MPFATEDPRSEGQSREATKYVDCDKQSPSLQAKEEKQRLYINICNITTAYKNYGLSETERLQSSAIRPVRGVTSNCSITGYLLLNATTASAWALAFMFNII